MNRRRGILYLCDPMAGSEKTHSGITKGLVFNENGPLLSQAQEALWQLRREHGWVCAAGEGAAAFIALSLAAQLPVDRVALLHPLQKRSKLPRELCRLRSFARRNLALVTAEILLVGADEVLISGMARGMGHRRLCALDRLEPDGLALPWESLWENNLLNPGNCV